VQFDPVTGNRMEKPRLSDSIPLGGQMAAPRQAQMASAGSVRPDVLAMAQGMPQLRKSASVTLAKTLVA